MDYASSLKTALIIGASGGIGRAVTMACQDRGMDVHTLSRQKDGLEITNETSVRAAATSIPDDLDLIIVATGALEIEGMAPEKTIRAVTPGNLLAQFQTNALGPALILKHFTPKLTKTRQSVIVTLSARVGSINDNRLGGWIAYRAAKAALNQIIRTTAIELNRTRANAICVAYHPGTVQTPLTQKYLKTHQAVSPAKAAHNLMAVVDNLTPKDTGQFLDWAGQPIKW